MGCMLRSPWFGVRSAQIVAYVIVGMAGLTFAACAFGNAPAKPAPSSTATAAVSHAPKDQWIVSAALPTNTFPILAPSDPRVIYQVTSPAGPLRRSTDEGKTWQIYSLPARVATSVNIYVSPLTADTAFLSAHYPSLPTDGAHCVQASTAITADVMPGSAGGECDAQWVSLDGGAHWSTPSYPLPAPMADLAPPFWSGAPEFIQAQGNTLFGALYCHEPLCSNTGYRIVRSADGGLTWRLVDADIAAGHHNVCDFAPAPEGTTLFAVSADISCATALQDRGPDGAYASFLLWRSDDAGQRWSQVGALPASVGGHLLVGPTPAGGQPLLYGDTWASVDGGVTWHAGPFAGVPAGARVQMLGVEHDGSLLIVAIPTTVIGTVTETVYRWRAGDPSWRQVGAALPSTVSGFAATRDAAGQETLWLTLPIGPFTSANGAWPPTPTSYQIDSLLE